MPQPGQSNAIAKYVSPTELGPSNIVLDSSQASNGTLLIGNGQSFVPGSLVGGANVTITPGAGEITISAALEGGVLVADGDYGDVTVSGTGTVWTVDNYGGSVGASQITGVNANTIIGSITASQIGSVNANTITGTITSGQIGSVSASAIIGSITSSQIGSVAATTITGSITSSQIGSVAAGVITGQLTATQIGAVSANVITGSITASQISTVGATSITGSITSSQIGSVSAGTITGVIVTNQLADQILSTQRLIASDLSVIRRVASLPSLPNTNYPTDAIVLNTTNEKLYKNNSGTWTLMEASDVLTGTLTANDIASVNATSITGLIISSQIGSVAASTITGSITASQIGSVNAASVQGTLSASQIGTVNASSITGALTASQISTVNASSIQGSLTASQISTVNAASIQGSITSSQIGSVAATSITGAITSGQISSVSAGAITGTLSASQIGSINAATITIGLIADGQVGSISAGKLTAGTIGAHTIQLNGASSIIQSTNFSSGSAGWRIQGNGTAEFMNAIVNGTVKGGATSFSSGTGFWMGLDSGVYKFRVGDPSGSRISWDGSNWTVVGVPVSVAEAETPTFTTTGAYNITFNKPSGMPSGYSVQYQQGSSSVTPPLVGFPFTLNMASGSEQLIVWANAPGYTQSQILYTSWNDLFL